MDIRKLQRAIVDGLEDVKGQNIVVFNTEHLSPLFERVIIASGTSNRQTKSLASSVRESVKASGFPVLRTEGEANGEWIIVDCGAAVVHVMQPSIREYYHLEEIWGDKPVNMKLASPTVGLVKAEEPGDGARPARKRAAAPKAASPKPADTQARAVAATAGKAAAGKSAAAKPAARKAPAREGAGTKTAARTSAADKAPARKTAAPQPPARRPAKGASTVTRVVGVKRATAKSPAAKAPAARKSTTAGAKPRSAVARPAAPRTAAPGTKASGTNAPAKRAKPAAKPTTRKPASGKPPTRS